jgi:hypothetical protein
MRHNTYRISLNEDVNVVSSHKMDNSMNKLLICAVRRRIFTYNVGPNAGFVQMTGAKRRKGLSGFSGFM